MVEIMPKEHLYKEMQNTSKTIWIFFYCGQAEKSFIFQNLFKFLAISVVTVLSVKHNKNSTELHES